MGKEENIGGIASIQTDTLYPDNAAVITGNVLKPLSKLFRLKRKSKRGICTLQIGSGYATIAKQSKSIGDGIKERWKHCLFSFRKLCVLYIYICMKYEMRARRRRNRMYKCKESNDD